MLFREVKGPHGTPIYIVPWLVLHSLHWFVEQMYDSLYQTTLATHVLWPTAWIKYTPPFYSRAAEHFPLREASWILRVNSRILTPWGGFQTGVEEWHVLPEWCNWKRQAVSAWCRQLWFWMGLYSKASLRGLGGLIPTGSSYTKNGMVL